MLPSTSASRRRRLAALLAVAALVPLVFALGSANAQTTELFLSEYIEGSSNNKALEIYNGTGAPVDLAAGAYNVQMYFNGSTSAGLTINLTGTVAAGDVFVLGHSSADPAILAEADQTNGAGWFNGDDAVVLRHGTTIVDVLGQIGFDPGTEWGTGDTSTGDNTLRRKPTVLGGDTNGSDAFDPALEWDGFPQNTFGGLGSHSATPGDAAPSVTASDPAAGATGVAVDADLSVTFSEPVATAGDWFSITCAVSGSHTATATGGPTTFTLDPSTDFALGETCTTTIAGAQVTDADTDDPPDTMAGNFAWSFTTVGLPARIHEIQGAAHRSPLEGRAVADVPGVVTALVSNGFFYEDPQPDGNEATSEGLFVFTGATPSVQVGDAVAVGGLVTEFRPGGSGSTNLSQTEIVAPTIAVLSGGNPLPEPDVIGRFGRIPPGEVIDDDATGNVETSGSFDAATDGIDFYESFESMLVLVDAAVAVGPTNDFGEIPVVGDRGSRAHQRTKRGGLVIAPDDFNPERIHLDDRLADVPDVNVGDRFPGAVVGVLDYSFGNFKLDVLETPLAAAGGIEREVARAAKPKELTVAAFNVENLDPNDGPMKFDRLADLIVDHLRSPDLLALEEVQDSNGPVNDATVDATLTYETLIAAIQAAGGPTYEFRQVNPEDDQDGGEPGGNIRVGFLFRTDRGLEFVDRPGATATTPTGVVAGASGPELTLSPGRIDPTNAAFENSRKPLAGEFLFRGTTVFVVANHFNSKGGDDPLFGRFQPPTRSSEVQRNEQAQVVNDFVDSILALDAQADVIVLGDLNDFEFSDAIATLKGGALHALVDELPKGERYTYVFEGNSQVLDHILVSTHLLGEVAEYDIVHVNAEFADQASDHDPQVAFVKSRD